MARHRAMPRGANEWAETGSAWARSTSTFSSQRWKRSRTGRVSNAHWATRSRLVVVIAQTMPRKWRDRNPERALARLTVGAEHRSGGSDGTTLRSRRGRDRHRVRGGNSVPRGGLDRRSGRLASVRWDVRPPRLRAEEDPGQRGGSGSRRPRHERPRRPRGGARDRLAAVNEVQALARRSNARAHRAELGEDRRRPVPRPCPLRGADHAGGR